MSTNDTNHPSTLTLTPAAIAAIEQAASEQYGLRLRYSPEQLDQPKAKKPPTTKPNSRKKPPTGSELEQLITADVQDRPSTCASRFYHLWPEKDRKRAKANVSNAFNRLVKAGKLTKHGHGGNTYYKQVK